MPILSDRTIRAHIAKNELVLNGTNTSAVHCAYEFSAETIFRGGASGPEVIGDQVKIIEPAELAWVKAKETVTIPSNMVGVWVQTQTLSRQGLLLLNTTIVEPGYSGPLTAVFVNFGSRRVALDRSTKIAKVLFVRLDESAEVLVDPSKFQRYDQSILEVASNSPKSFLQLDSHLPSIEKEAAQKLQEMDTRLKEKVEELKKELASATQGHVLRWGGGVAAGLALGCLAIWFAVATLLPQMVASYSSVKEMSEKAFDSKQSTLLERVEGDLKNKAMLDEIKKDIEQLKKDRLDWQAAMDRAQKRKP